MKPLTRLALFCVALMSGCEKAPREGQRITAERASWFYLVAREARFRDPSPDAEIRDQRLILTDPETVRHGSLESMTNRGVTIAMPVTFQTMLVTGAVGRAAIPKNRGKVLPTVVDRKIELHFLSQINGKWYSTNTLRTRVVSVTCTP